MSMLVTSTLRDKLSEKNGPRKTVFGVRPNKKHHEDKKMGLDTATFPYAMGEKYTGDWSNNMKEGFGTQIWVKGHKYEGEWLANKRHGKGTFWVKEGRSVRKQYAGDWVNDKRHGLGVFMYRNGDQYEGEWQENRRHGRGKMIYSSGEMYEGEWANDKRSGLGIYVMANGDRYEGHWLDDKKEGPGHYFYSATGKVLVGEWVNDMSKCGEYTDSPPENSIFQGTSLGPNANPPGHFHLPALGVAQPDAILGETVAHIRQQRAHQKDYATSNDPLRARATDQGGRHYGNSSGGYPSDYDDDYDVEGGPGAGGSGGGGGGGDSRIFTAGEMEALRKIFYSLDNDAKGLVPCGQIGTLLEAVGIELSEAEIDDLIDHLGADPSTEITFAEFVDIASILADAGGNPNEDEDGGDMTDGHGHDDGGGGGGGMYK